MRILEFKLKIVRVCRVFTAASADAELACSITVNKIVDVIFAETLGAEGKRATLLDFLDPKRSLRA